MLLYDVLQQGLPMTVVPQWIDTKGRMSIVSLRPRYPTMHFSAFRISKSEECLIVKDWSKIVNDHREVLGAAIRSAAHDQETGSSACSHMMNQESYTCSMLFYQRESSRSDQLARNEFEDDHMLHYYYDDKIASVGGNDYDDD